MPQQSNLYILQLGGLSGWHFKALEKGEYTDTSKQHKYNSKARSQSHHSQCNINWVKLKVDFSSRQAKNVLFWLLKTSSLVVLCKKKTKFETAKSILN